MTSASLFAVLEIKRFVQVKTLAAGGGKGGCLQKPPLKKVLENLFSKTISVFTLNSNLNENKHFVILSGASAKSKDLRTDLLQSKP